MHILVKSPAARRLAAVASAALLIGPLGGLTGQEPGAAPRGLGLVADSVIMAAMRTQDIPGAVVVIVRDGAVLHARGYGIADRSTGRPMSPDSTIVPIGSITKAITATAAMQLVEAGTVRLDRNVNDYLRRVRVRDTLGAAVTLAHLLSHTAGFDEIRPGTQADSAGGILPLHEFLGTRLVRIRPAGTVPSYSTYGITLTGLLIEDVTGMSYAQYLAQRVFAPAGMRDSWVRVPAAARRRVGPGYELRNGVNVPEPAEWYHTEPASSVHATAADMGRFMLAQLGHRAGLLSGSTRTLMHASHARGHPDVPGVAYGFFEGDFGGVRVLEHGGAVAGMSSLLALLPDEGIGIFVASHHEGNSLGEALKQALISHLHPTPAVPGATAPAPGELERFAGTYVWNVYCHTCGRPAPSRGPSVAVNPDGTLAFAGQRWIRTGPLLFSRDDGRRVMGFREDGAGGITHLFIDGPVTFERVRP